MATLQDITIIAFMTLAFTYLVIYKKNKFVGNLFFIITGISLYTIIGDNPFGLIVAVGGFISMLYDWFSK